jgi:hypothetical protein
MSRVLLITIFIIISLVVGSQPASAQSVTALYRVIKIQHVFKLTDTNCVEKKEQQCQKSEHWRVFYRALSLQVSPQKHQILFDENPPQVGAVSQLTINTAAS